MGSRPSSMNIHHMDWALEDRAYVQRLQQEAAARKIELQKQVQLFSAELFDLVGETEWEKFWEPISEGASNDELLSLLQDELARRSGHGDSNADPR